MIGPLGRLGTAATLGQHCPQMTQRRCISPDDEVEVAPLVDVVPGLAGGVDEDVGVLGVRLACGAALRLEWLQRRRHQALELGRRPPRLGLEEAHLQERWLIVCSRLYRVLVRRTKVWVNSDLGGSTILPGSR